ncbi:MAG: NAD(P)-dependent oxidoreductase [Bacteroidota bacterium]|nr:NAD(P)-dependent oxidoreductase [Bacteroidota bacterium]
MVSAKKNILVIGSNSFLASCLISKLKTSANIIGVYNQATNLHQPDVSYVNIIDIDKLEDKFELVYLISAYIPQGNKWDNGKLYDVNVGLTEKVAEKFKSAHLVLASSVSVYGESDTIINEESPSQNANQYGLSKLWAEAIVKQHPSFAINRISSMYGIQMKTSTFLPLIIKNALLKGKITLMGDGARRQNYINVDDVAESLIKSGERSFNRIFLSVSENSHSNAEIAAIIKKYLPDTIIEHQGTDNSLSYLYDSELTRKVLGWNCKIETEAGIKQLIEWIRKES